MSFNPKSTEVFQWGGNADVLTITTTDGKVQLRGMDVTDWIRDQIVANFCPRCGGFLRSQRMPLDFQCAGCDAFDEQ